MALPLESGVRRAPLRVVLYGSEGVGKTTMASMMPHPVFIDVEDGSNQLDVQRMPRPTSWEMLMGQLELVAGSASELSTLVVDTVDAAEALCCEHVCKAHDVNSMEGLPYGKMYQYLVEEMRAFLDRLDVVRAMGVNVVVVSHAIQRKVDRPDTVSSYDHFEMKLQKRVAPIVKEWADMILFCDFEVDVVKADNGKAKARGARRVIHATHNPAWDAKNRFGMPDTLTMDEASIAKVASLLMDHMADGTAEDVPFAVTAQEAAEEGEYEGAYATLNRLMAESGVGLERLALEIDVRHGEDLGHPDVAKRGIGALPEAYVEWLCGAWPQVAASING